jgi:hypothetical protein
MSLRLNYLFADYKHIKYKKKTILNQGDVMKKSCLIGAFLFSIFAAQPGFTNCGTVCGSGSYGGSYGGVQPQPESLQPEEAPTGNCVCQYVQYIPYPYTINRCYQEQVPYQVQRCRWEPRYYQVQRCRYEPQYYSVTQCQMVPKYYSEQRFKTITRTIPEPACRYVSKYYWKTECNGGGVAAPQGCCGDYQMPCCN